ncbi:hypothetical protein [uncultured Corynebacterium sp.]|uniref:hypothetical protein n=1 Tax=uncultured Corynebacterium sp. TaxID=159447 RepID=UPI0025E16D97|nr:hypothetical protein [uncultured Corynebacterium sp.]
MTTYKPLIDAPGATPDTKSLQVVIETAGATHVQTRSGEVYKIFNRLNLKSVPINASDPNAPQRIPYTRVKSFGVMADEEAPTTAEVEQLTRKEKLLSRENLEVAMLQDAVVKELTKIAKDSKSDIHSVLADGEKQLVRNERGVELGSIYRTSPKPTARVVDLAAVAAQADEAGEELEYRLPAPGTAEYQQAVELVLVHNEDLLVLDLTPEAVKNLSEKVLAEWQVTGKVPVGWEIVEGKSGYTAIRPNAVGKEIVQRLMSGQQDLLAEVTRKEIA